MIKQKMEKATNWKLVIEYLEQKLMEGKGCDREYGLYLDYREVGVKAAMKNKGNKYIWSRLREEVRCENEGVFE